jgi:serine phosphatase RsbU (regulator of sigma subunit)
MTPRHAATGRAAAGPQHVRARPLLRRVPGETPNAAQLTDLLERVTRLQEVTAALSAAAGEDAVADALLRQGTQAAGATCAVLGLTQRAGLVVRHRLGMAATAPATIAYDHDGPIAEAARTREPVLLASRTAWLERFSVAPRTDFEAFAALPLLVDGTVRGCLGLGFPTAREFDDADREFFTALAMQGAQALQRAWLYEDRAHFADVLARELLPAALPAVPGLEVATRYRPVGGETDFSGDFFDLFEAGDAWTAVVGDVQGKGVEAAVETSVARHTIRAAGRGGAAPEVVAEALNRAVLDRGEAARFCSLVVVRLVRDADGGFDADFVVAGHPPPLVLRAGGALEELPRGAGLVGVAPELGAVRSRVRLAAGDALVLYTDGITDARAGDRTFGEEGLAACVTSARASSAEDLAAHVDAAVQRADAGPARDDVALMVLRVARTPEGRVDEGRNAGL